MVHAAWEGSIKGLAFSQSCKQRFSKLVPWAEGNQFGGGAGQLEGSAFDLLRCRRRFDHPLCSIIRSGVVPTITCCVPRAIYTSCNIPHVPSLTLGSSPLLVHHHRITCSVPRAIYLYIIYVYIPPAICLVRAPDPPASGSDETGEHIPFHCRPLCLPTHTLSARSFRFYDSWIHDLTVDWLEFRSVFSNGRGVDLALDNHRDQTQGILYSNIDLGESGPGEDPGMG